MRCHPAVAVVASVARPQQQDCRQRHPAAKGMHHHAAGKIVEGLTELRLDHRLQAKVVVPDHAFEQRIEHSNDYRGGDQLRHKPRPLSDAPRDDGWDGRRKRQQKEELDEVIAGVLSQRRGICEKTHTISDAVADKEVGQGRHRKIDQDLY